MQFIEQLLSHIDKLRDEIRMNELILHSVVKSLSAQTEEMMQLDLDLHQHVTTTAHHKPLILTAEEQQRLQHMREALDRDLANINTNDQQRN